MKWIKTEHATLERARELLANRIADLPIWVRWNRTFYGGNTGTAFGQIRQYETCELVGVTAKRLKLKAAHGGTEHSVEPSRCYFATREER